MNKKIKTQFDFQDYEVTAYGRVENEDEVEITSIRFYDIEYKDYPKGELLEVITEEAKERLLEAAYLPELDFD